MSYISEAELRRRRTRLDEGHRKLAKAITADTDLFVSYARMDRDLVWGAVEMLVELGATPYLDQQDAVLRELTTTAKAARLRERINRCGRLMLVLTEESVVSNWTPWEVGLADGLHGVNKVATLPIKSIGGSDEWGLREYLATYPQLQKVTLQGDTAPCKAVYDPSNGKYWRFAKWISL